MSTALRGKELAAAVVAVVEQHPEQHDQGKVTCGTTACLAGWTIALAHGLSTESELPKWADLIGEDGDPAFAAMQLLNLDPGREDEFIDRVFINFSADDAISAFIELTGLAEIPALPASERVSVLSHP
jgi:hypothetical protein